MLTLPAMWSLMASSHCRCSSVKGPSGGLLHRHPALEPLLHLLGEGSQLLVVPDGEAHQRHDVGQHSLAGAAHPRLVKLPVGVPEPPGSPGTGRALQGVGQGPDVGVAQPLAVGAFIQDLQRRYLVSGSPRCTPGMTAPRFSASASENPTRMRRSAVTLSMVCS